MDMEESKPETGEIAKRIQALLLLFLLLMLISTKDSLKNVAFECVGRKN